MDRTRRIAVLLLVGVLAVAGCSSQATTRDDGHADHGDATPAGDDARTIEVTANDFAFNPDPIEMNAGEEVEIALTSADALPHDFVIDDVGFHVTAEPGGDAAGALRIDEPGTYTAYCSEAGHRESGMEATVVVSE